MMDGKEEKIIPIPDFLTCPTCRQLMKPFRVVETPHEPLDFSYYRMEFRCEKCGAFGQQVLSPSNWQFQALCFVVWYAALSAVKTMDETVKEVTRYMRAWEKSKKGG